MTKSRIFLLLLLSFIGGIGVRSFATLPYAFLFFLSSFVGTLAAFGFYKGNKMLIVLGFCAALFMFGVFRYEQKLHHVADPRVFSSDNFIGVVQEKPVRKASVQELIVLVRKAGGTKMESLRSLVTLRKYPEYKLGDEIIFSGTLKKPENFGEFDYVSYLRGKNIVAVSSFPQTKKIGDGQANPLHMQLSRIKHAFEEKIDILFAEPYAALLKGLLLGERALLPESFLDALKTTGTTHIVALSGYNITLVGALLLSSLLRLNVSFRMAFWTASACIVLFVLMTGASASVVRAGIMGMLVLIAQNEGRAYNMANALIFAAVLMIFYNPFILRFDIGFQLSFLATCGIIYLPSCIEPHIARVKNFFSNMFGKKRNVLAEDSNDSGFSRWIETTLAETLSAQIFVLPLLIHTFGSISLISIITNLAVLLAVPYAMGWGFVAVIIGFLLTPLARLVAVAPWILLSYIIYCIEWFAKTPYAAVTVHFFPWYAMMVGYLFIAVWVIRSQITKHYGLRPRQ